MFLVIQDWASVVSKCTVMCSWLLALINITKLLVAILRYKLRCLIWILDLLVVISSLLWWRAVLWQPKRYKICYNLHFLLVTVGLQDLFNRLFLRVPLQNVWQKEIQARWSCTLFIIFGLISSRLVVINWFFFFFFFLLVVSHYSRWTIKNRRWVPKQWSSSILNTLFNSFQVLSAHDLNLPPLALVLL